ncbi:MAG: AmmeMemoRadiSam system protein B, partial [Spirochaetia bacterium]|nr:AmmeMemoRadiSam system protein B [Spirochaetia bacterium]
MQMLETHHHTLFYPASEKALSDATKARERSGKKLTLPGAMLCPHASYHYVLQALHRSFSSVGAITPSLVVFLGPLHKEILTCDEPAFLVSTEREGIRIGELECRFSSSLIKTLQKEFPATLCCQDSYFEEEAAFELTIPFIESYFPGVPILPLLSGGMNSKQIKMYAQILNSIVEKHNDTLFIVSANSNALLPSQQAKIQAEAFLSSLQAGQGFLDNLVSSCNKNSLQALSLIPSFKGPWEVT